MLPSKCLIEPVREIFLRQHAKNAKKKNFLLSPNLACFASLRESSFFRLAPYPSQLSPTDEPPAL